MQFDTVTKFRNGRRQFIAQMNEITRRAKAGELTAAEAREYQQVADDAKPLASKLDTVEGMIRSAESTLHTSLGSLGVLPVVAPAVIIAAIVAVSYLLERFLTRTSEFLARSDYLKKRTAQGVPADQALQEYNKNNPKDGGLFGDLSKLVWPLAIVAGAIIFSRK